MNNEKTTDLRENEQKAIKKVLDRLYIKIACDLDENNISHTMCFLNNKNAFEKFISQVNIFHMLTACNTLEKMIYVLNDYELSLKKNNLINVDDVQFLLYCRKTISEYSEGTKIK